MDNAKHFGVEESKAFFPRLPRNQDMIIYKSFSKITRKSTEM